MNTTMEEGYYYYGSTALPSDSGFGSGFLSSSNPSLNAGSGFYFDDAQQNPRLSNMNAHDGDNIDYGYDDGDDDHHHYTTTATTTTTLGSSSPDTAPFYP